MSSPGVSRRTGASTRCSRHWLQSAHHDGRCQQRRCAGHCAGVPGPDAGAVPHPGSLALAAHLLRRWHHDRVRGPSKYTLTFLANGTYSCPGGLQSGQRSLSPSGSQLTLQPGPMTRAACPRAHRTAVFLRDLGQVATYVFDGENLVLNLEMDSGNMVFSPRPPVALTGRAWQVLSVNNGEGAVVSVRAGDAARRDLWRERHRQRQHRLQRVPRAVHGRPARRSPSAR